MPTRFVCPHCHHSVDPQEMDAGYCTGVELRVCPACDTPIVREAALPPAAHAGSLAPAAAPEACEAQRIC